MGAGTTGAQIMGAETMGAETTAYDPIGDGRTDGAAMGARRKEAGPRGAAAPGIGAIA
jgi:hypothetical protein